MMSRFHLDDLRECRSRLERIVQRLERILASSRKNEKAVKLLEELIVDTKTAIAIVTAAVAFIQNNSITPDLATALNSLAAATGQAAQTPPAPAAQ